MDGVGGARRGILDDGSLAAFFALDDAEVLIARVAREERSQWSTAARAERVEALHRLCDVAQAALVAAAADLDRDAGWKVDNAVSLNQWLTAKTQSSRERASLTTLAVRLIRRFDATAAALASGELSPAKLDVLASRVTKARLHLYERHEAALLDAARRLKRVDDFALVVARWASLADDEISNADAVAGRRRRRLHLSMVGDRGIIRGEVTADEFAIIDASIKALLPPDKVDIDGHRPSVAERRAEALVEVHRRSLSEHVGNGGGPTSAVDVVIDAELLADDLSSGPPPPADTSSSNDDAVPRRCDRHLADRPIDLTTAHHDIAGVGPVPVETVRRLLCDSYVARVVMQGRSEVLDLGRNSRFFTENQKKVIRLRDGGCIAQGCDRGPEWCQTHHLRWWEAHRGDTDVPNGVLLCGPHHHLVHEGGWYVDRDAHGRFVLVKPDGRHRAKQRHLHADPDRELTLATRRRVAALVAERDPHPHVGTVPGHDRGSTDAVRDGDAPRSGDTRRDRRHRGDRVRRPPPDRPPGG